MESGDRLSWAEFERRYKARPDIKKAELIEGVVYVASSVRHTYHGQPVQNVQTWLGVYRARTRGLRSSDNGTIPLDRANEPQPDAMLMLRQDVGGQARVDADDYVAGAPELIVEVAASSASYDLGQRKNAYRRNGVREYVVWRVFDEEIDWFVLRDDAYQRLEPSSDGILRSQVFPGPWLDRKAMLEDRMDGVLDTLDLGLASSEHAAFKARLQAKA